MTQKWINRTDRQLTEVEEFINEFMTHSAKTEEELEMLRSLFRAGYCYHFAHILLATFGRGCVVWAAPFGHICWQDVDGVVYDIEGEYVGEAFYMIPEEFIETQLSGCMLDFKHIPNRTFNAKTSELIAVCKAYCQKTGKYYDSRIEGYFSTGVKEEAKDILSKYDEVMSRDIRVLTKQGTCSREELMAIKEQLHREYEEVCEVCNTLKVEDSTLYYEFIELMATIPVKWSWVYEYRRQHAPRALVHDALASFDFFVKEIINEIKELESSKFHSGKLQICLKVRLECAIVEAYMQYYVGEFN